MQLGAIEHNLRRVRDAARRPVCAVVKANAYGHGQAAVTAMSGADCFATATCREARELSAVTDKPILILGAAEADLPANAVPSVGSRRDADVLRAAGYKGGVQLKINTGMNRLGFSPDETDEAVRLVKRAGWGLEGVFTHFHFAENPEITARQFALFDGCTRSLACMRHCCASSALFLPERYLLDMVRPGLALYGYGADGLKKAMTVETEIVQLNRVKKGGCVGYGETRLTKSAVIATARGGYADGFRRTNAERLVTVRGKRCPVVGRVCMDMFFIDVTDAGARVGDKVLLPDAQALAGAYGTIAYEVLTGFSQARGGRVYLP